MDSVKESELIVSFSVLPRWLGLEDKRISDRESLAGASEGKLLGWKYVHRILESLFYRCLKFFAAEKQQ